MTLDAEQLKARTRSAVQNTGGTTAIVTTFASSYDPTTGVNTRTETTYPGVVCSPITLHQRTTDAELDAAVAGVLYVPALGLLFEPKEGQRWVIGGQTYTSLNVETTFVADQAVMFTVQLQKGGA